MSRLPRLRRAMDRKRFRSRVSTFAMHGLDGDLGAFERWWGPGVLGVIGVVGIVLILGTALSGWFQ